MSQTRATRITYRRRLEVIIPLFLLLLCGSLVIHQQRLVFALARIDENTSRIPLGVHTFYILHGSHCVGTLSSNISEGRLRQWRAEGSLQLTESTSGQRITQTANLTLTSSYNPLQQLFEGTLTLRLKDTHLELRAKNVHPVFVTLTVSAPALNVSRELQLPGPIELNRVSDDAYVLKYHYLSQLAPKGIGSTSPLAASLQQLSSLMQLSIADSETNPDACTHQSTFDIAALRQSISLMAPVLLQHPAAKAIQNLNTGNE